MSTGTSCNEDFGYSGNLPRKITKLFMEDHSSVSILKNNIGVVASPKILYRTIKWFKRRCVFS